MSEEFEEIANELNASEPVTFTAVLKEYKIAGTHLILKFADSDGETAGLQVRLQDFIKFDLMELDKFKDQLSTEWDFANDETHYTLNIKSFYIGKIEIHCKKISALEF